jgi:hypothetical protein
VANTQKALEQSEKERKADEQIQRVENFIKDLTMNLNNMLTKFHFLKERKNRRQQQLTDRQVSAMTEFAVFVKTLTGNVSSLLNRFQESQTFEEKIDKEIKELEASIGQKLQEFDKVLEKTTNSSTGYLINFAQSITSSFAKLPRVRNIVLAAANTCRDVSATRRRGKLNKLPKKSPQIIKEDSQIYIQDTGDSQLEKILSCSITKSVKSNGKKSKCLMHLKV